MNSVLRFLYGFDADHLNLSHENVVEVLLASDMFVIDHMRIIVYINLFILGTC